MNSLEHRQQFDCLKQKLVVEEQLPEHHHDLEQVHQPFKRSTMIRIWQMLEISLRIQESLRVSNPALD